MPREDITLGHFVDGQNFAIDGRIVSEHNPPYTVALADRDMLISLLLYVRHGIPTGGFLTAVLCNDLSRAMSSAHPSLPIGFVRHLVLYIHTYLPATCYGSREIVNNWIRQNMGREKAAQWHDRAVKDVMGDHAFLCEDLMEVHGDKYGEAVRQTRQSQDE